MLRTLLSTSLRQLRGLGGRRLASAEPGPGVAAGLWPTPSLAAVLAPAASSSHSVHASAALPQVNAREDERMSGKGAAATSVVASACDSFRSPPLQQQQEQEQEQEQELQQGGPELEIESEPLDWRNLSPKEFSYVADQYIGMLWTKIERGLREAEGEEFDYEVRPDHGAMRVLLPYDGKLVIRKDPEGGMLVVESNLFEPWEDKDSIEFRPVDEGRWDNEDGESLNQFVSEALGKYLKADVQV